MRCHIDLVIEMPDTLKVGDSVGEGEILKGEGTNDAIWYEGVLKDGKSRPQQWKIWVGWSSDDGMVEVDGELWYDDEGSRCYCASMKAPLHETGCAVRRIADRLYEHRIWEETR